MSIDETLFKKLSGIDSVSGDERAISLALKSEYESLADSIVYDNLGSIFAVKKSKKADAPRVMIVGHMDESGFILKGINGNGTIRALALGNIEATSLLGASVKLKTRNDKTFIGTLLAHDKSGSVLDQSNEVLVDFGFENKEEVLENNLAFGDRLSFTSQNRVSSNGKRIYCKNWDGRYAPLMGIEVMRAIKDQEFDFDLYVGCTVQEQVGFRGIQTATNLVKPDLGIVLDTNKAFDYQMDLKEKNGELGKGMLINFYDTTVLPNRLLLTTLKNICIKHNLPHQYYYSMEGSDAAWINKLRTGTPTLFVNVPIRNMNTPSSIMDIRDYEAAKKALLLFLNSLTVQNIQEFKEENR
ncbi:M42 family metallopeptidase [Candidatus Enterococcus murrayae]|uniref:M42 family peptidase n=1 Tax=Candidatus Enterococcus murrayae TaxID=2815321 RepID=A0ABS3HDE3_9ENTE|nr:M42 family peptidase [Enterococcus sp. MJM16]MBO0451483.1 M42 family peptidase [Enterococcus sp. MJM16]